MSVAKFPTCDRWTLHQPGAVCVHCPTKDEGMTTERLEYLRQQIRAERISWYEIAELQGLADEIEPWDVELLEWAGVPESEATEGTRP